MPSIRLYDFVLNPTKRHSLLRYVTVEAKVAEFEQVEYKI